MRSKYCAFLAAGILAIVIVGLRTLASADDEFVTLVKILSNVDHGIVVRRDGDAYQIVKGFGCLSFWQYEAKTVLVSSPGLFLGLGSELVLPNDNQRCRIWDAKKLGPWNIVQKGISADRTKRSTPKPTSSKCVTGRRISNVIRNGQFVVLEDRSEWEVNGIDAMESVSWLPTQEVLICGKQMINGANGKIITVTRIR